MYASTVLAMVFVAVTEPTAKPPPVGAAATPRLPAPLLVVIFEVSEADRLTASASVESDVTWLPFWMYALTSVWMLLTPPAPDPAAAMAALLKAAEMATPNPSAVIVGLEL